MWQTSSWSEAPRLAGSKAFRVWGLGFRVQGLGWFRVGLRCYLSLGYLASAPPTLFVGLGKENDLIMMPPQPLNPKP